MTTHEMAVRLINLPDVELVIEGWCKTEGSHTMSADMTEYDPVGTAIIWQKPNDLNEKVLPCKRSG